MRLAKLLTDCPREGRIRLSFECGMDEAECERQKIQLFRNGLVIHSPWQFAEGSLVSVSIGCSACRCEVESQEALVLSCERQEEGEPGYRLTLYFLDAISYGGPDCATETGAVPLSGSLPDLANGEKGDGVPLFSGRALRR